LPELSAAARALHPQYAPPMSRRDVAILMMRYPD